MNIAVTLRAKVSSQIGYYKVGMLVPSGGEGSRVNCTHKPSSVYVPPTRCPDLYAGYPEWVLK